MRNSVIALIIAAGWIAAAASPASAQSRGDASGNGSAAQNVRESQQYEQLVCSNPSFRERRMREECGPITDPQMHQNCLATFNCGSGGPSGRNFRGAPASEQVR
jgi:hypothetical protein